MSSIAVRKSPLVVALSVAIGAILAFAVAVAFTPTEAHAATPAVPKAGTTFKVDGNTYKITDRWKSAKKPGEVVLVTYGSSKTNVTINTVKYQGKVYEVEEIGKNAFNNAKGHKITSVTFGKNVEEIGYRAFYGCNKLKTINIAASEVVEIDYNKRTKSYYIDDVEISSQAFKNAGVKNVTVKCGNNNAKYKALVKKALTGKGLRSTAVVVK